MYVYTIYIYMYIQYQYIHVLILSHAQPEFSLSSPKEWSKAVAASSLSRQQRHSQNRVFETSGTREFQERSLSTLCQPTSLEWVPQRSPWWYKDIRWYQALISGQAVVLKKIWRIRTIAELVNLMLSLSPMEFGNLWNLEHVGTN